MSKPLRTNQKTYTIKGAARRVDRSEVTIKTWLRQGMKRHTVAGMVVIDHDDLMQRFRTNILARARRKDPDSE